MSRDSTDNQLLLPPDMGMYIAGIRNGWIYLAAHDSPFFGYGVYRMKIDGDGEIEKVLVSIPYRPQLSMIGCM